MKGRLRGLQARLVPADQLASWPLHCTSEAGAGSFTFAFPVSLQLVDYLI